MNLNEIVIYRVRKSPFNIRSQKGAYLLLENAVKKAKSTKCNVYDNKKNCVWNFKMEVN